MTARTLFNIILKILGLFFIKDFLLIIPQLLSVAMYLSDYNTVTEAFWTLAFTILTLLAYGFVSYIFIFRTNSIIDKLKLDKDFGQETIPLNTHRSTILSIAIVVIGGLLVVDQIPNFCRHLFSYFQEKRMTHGQTTPSLSYSILSGVKIIIGFLLMTERKHIVNFIERRRKA